jgi:hypothetical protein
MQPLFTVTKRAEKTRALTLAGGALAVCGHIFFLAG